MRQVGKVLLYSSQTEIESTPEGDKDQSRGKLHTATLKNITVDSPTLIAQNPYSLGVQLFVAPVQVL